MTKQITLRLPEELHDELRQVAERKGISINEEIIFRIHPIDVPVGCSHADFRTQQCNFQ